MKPQTGDMTVARLKSGFAVLILITVFTSVASITTTHHDKPEDAKPSVMATKMKNDELKSKLNESVNLESSERHKRLLPYMTFYLEHDFNRPQNNYNQQKYQQIAPQKSISAHFQNKYNELTASQAQNNKYTPFSESNALPGPFVPMRQPVKVAADSPQLAEVKVPNYSAIYDKLSQLKLQQQQHNQLAQSYNNFNHQYANANYARKPTQIITYVPQKNVIQTYTPSSIDIPNNEHYQIPVANIQKVPLKSIDIANLKAPHLDHALPATEEEHKQYLEDQKYVDLKKHVAKPIVIFRSKPRNPNYYPENQKPVLIIRRPVQKSPYYEIPIRYNQVYRPDNYEIEPVTPKYIDVVPKQERKPVYVTVRPKYEDLKYPEQVKKPVYITVTPKYEDVKYQVQYNLQNQNGGLKYPQYDEGSKYQTPDYDGVDEKYAPLPQFEENTNKYQNPHYEQLNPPVKYQEPINYENANAELPPLKYHQQQFPEHQPPQIYQQQPSHNYQPLIGKFAPSFEDHNTQTTAQGFQPISTYAPQFISTATEHPQPVHAEADNSNSLSVILKKLQDTNALPQTLTADNIDNSIKTLVKILSSFKRQQKFAKPIIVPEDTGDYEEDIDNEAGVGLGGPQDLSSAYPNTPEGGTPGKAGVDYPALSSIPQTSFNCKTQRYKGFFGDPDTNCQVWHYCDLNGGQASFLCPNGTIFSQVALTCDWWYNVKCANTPQLYVLNERLYKYILPLSPKFPEDYSGPLVDRYLAMKFQEMEEKMKKERKQNKEDSPDKDDDDNESSEEITDDADDLANEEKKKQAKAATSESPSSAENSAETNEAISKEK